MMENQENKERETTSIKTDPELWKEFKILCIRLDTTVQDRIEELIKEDIEKNKKLNSD